MTTKDTGHRAGPSRKARNRDPLAVDRQAGRSTASGSNLLASLGEAAGPDWVDTVPIDLPDLDPDVEHALLTGEPVVMNRYFADHPDHVLGRLEVGRGTYRRYELTVAPSGDLGSRLGVALQGMVAEAHARGATLTPPLEPGGGGRRPAKALSGDFVTTYAQEGSLVAARSGEVGRLAGGDVVAYRPHNAKEFWELRRLIGLRDAAREVLAIQLRDGTDDELAAAQAKLLDRYDTYRRYYGPLNRFRTVRTGRHDAETGERVTRRDFPAMGGFRRLDPDWSLVAALEVFDEEAQTAERAPLFSQRVVAPPERRTRVESAADAISICLDEDGVVTSERVAELLGLTPESARAEMGTLVFDDPETSALVPASEYLSGDVRRKLDVASAAVAAASDLRKERWQPNVEALQRALPRPLGPDEITARPGAAWIPAGDVEAFCHDVLGAVVTVSHMRELGRWQLKLRSSNRSSVALRSQWGTRRADAVALLEASLNQRLHTVYDTLEDKRRVRNDSETIAARHKQDALSDRFGSWVWEEPARAERLAATYNRLFRSTALRSHDGSRLTLPGLASNFEPRAHQRDAVARILTDGRALLAHAVGAGKTATMVMAAMEMRRLGSAAKPAVVVPNHMLEQFSREWLQLYPTARILVADAAQLDQGRRKEFVARCALGDWDGIVFTHSGFEHIPLGREMLAEYLHNEVDAARTALTEAKKSKSISVKRLEAMVRQAEQTCKRLLDAQGKDDGVRFEETGIDYVFIDSCRPGDYAGWVGRPRRPVVSSLGSSRRCWSARSA